VSAAGPDPGILATSDGRHFIDVAALPVPVLFPAVAVFGGKLYVFGGDAATGSDAGHAVDTIQVVDLKTHKAKDKGHLPEPLAGAAAVVLGHDVILAGGDTAPPGTGAQTATTSTQVGVLPVAVSHAGVAVLGSTAWLVGGESDGTPVSSVQSFITMPSGTRSAGSAGKAK
jgi:N-acetylneuraminic acid mutarotase